METDIANVEDEKNYHICRTAEDKCQTKALKNYGTFREASESL